MRSGHKDLERKLESSKRNFTKIKVDPKEVLNAEVIKQTGRKISDFSFIALFPEDNRFGAYMDNFERIDKDREYIIIDGLGWGIEIKRNTLVGNIQTYIPLKEQGITPNPKRAIVLIRKEPEIPYIMDAYAIQIE